MSSEEKLMPCPCHFCGSTATSAAFFRASDDYQGWQVECSSCGGSGPMNMNTEAEAITAWNTRPAREEVSGEGFLCFWYKNYRGEVSERTVRPIRIYHGATEWHPEPQWLLEAFDMEKDAVRAFAMADMQAAPEETTTIADMFDVSAMRRAMAPFLDLKAQRGAHGVISKKLNDFAPMTVTVTKAQMLAALRAFVNQEGEE